MFEILEDYHIESFIGNIEKGFINHSDGETYNVIEILSVDCNSRTVTLLIKK